MLYMSVSYNESFIHYILFNMELTYSLESLDETAIDDIDDFNYNDDHDIDNIDTTMI